MQNNDLFDKLGISEEEFNKNVKKYTESTEYTEYIDHLRKEHRKKIFLKILKWLKDNFWNIATLLIGIVTLIFSVLAYLKE